MTKQVACGRVDQRDGIGALRDALGVAVGPGRDGDAAHRMPGDDRAFTRRQHRLEDGVEIGGEVVKAVGVTPRGDAATAVAAMIERDDAVVAGKVRYLVGPHPDGARDAVREHDRIAVFWPEDLGVQVDAVLGADGHGATGRHRLGRGKSCGRRAGLLATSHAAPIEFGNTAGTHHPTGW